MPSFAVVTPSFGPDAELFAELHRSVLRYTPPETVHHVITPDVDRGLFARHESQRCRLWSHSELIPRRYLRLRPRGPRLNVRRPWPLVRGWVMQQALKIAVTGLVDADAVLIADSDVVLVRPADARQFIVDGRPGMYRNEGAVHAGMARHIHWHHVARRLLGLPPPEALPMSDYVTPLNVWSPSAARAMQQRISTVTGQHWMDAFTAQVHISEFIVYGVFVDEILAAAGQWPALDPMFCHNYWETEPLDLPGARSFANQLPPAAVGMMISSKSYTPEVARQAAIHRCAELADQRSGL